MTIAPVTPMKTAAEVPGVQLAKSETQKDDLFANCGKADNQETPAKPAKQKLTRFEWPLVMLKELVDNAIDACEEAEIAPVISVTVKRKTIANRRQWSRHSGQNHRRRSGLRHPGVLAGSVRITDARSAGQRAQDHLADGLCAGRAPR
jgi:hypothetical protein